MTRSVSTKATTVVMIAGLALGSAGGTAVVVAAPAAASPAAAAPAAAASLTAASSAAASPAAKQYKRIVAPVNKLLGAANPPSVSTLRAVFSTGEKKLSSAHWPAKARKDAKALVAAMKKAEPVLEKAATSANFKPNAAQTGKIEKLASMATTFRRDLGLQANNLTGL